MLSKEEVQKIFKNSDLAIFKSMGQNFLIDEKVLSKIIACSDLSSEDVVIEIGPGLGTLTEELSKRCKKVIAIEKDDKISQMLEGKFENVEVINGDILQINLSEIAQKYYQNKKYKLISNIPYYITSPIIKLFLENDVQPEVIVLLMQKEVAQRICEKKGKLSMIALGVQVYGEPKIIDFVKNTSFYPVPKVDSAILRIKNINREFTDKYYLNLFRIMKIGFVAKRKKLVNNLSAGLQIDKTQCEKLLVKAEIDLKARAQELGLEDWKKLVEIISQM
ncbi:MAG: 16S rRNA (adenine(1518)-N(6)/adenine(1519)-N(6))-dimethyltransferase RsmA [Patescibacteria group bacterium]|nr:16S rRNA (adenine(1518)-N(6)/adenine(1519)-N(6))-dimethyltransferase RsmA [Patescibacteria group bacterium]